jgi:hypothetical protein
MFSKSLGANAQTAPQARNCPGEGLPAVLTVKSDFEALTNETRADVDQDKNPYNGRITPDSVSRLGVQ